MYTCIHHTSSAANATTPPTYAIQIQIFSKMFLGTSSGHCPSSASRAAFPVVISASMDLMNELRFQIFQKAYRAKKIGIPIYAARKSEEC